MFDKLCWRNHFFSFYVCVSFLGVVVIYFCYLIFISRSLTCDILLDFYNFICLFYFKGKVLFKFPTFVVPLCFLIPWFCILSIRFILCSKTFPPRSPCPSNLAIIMTDILLKALKYTKRYLEDFL